jgi:hypothetical protein
MTTDNATIDLDERYSVEGYGGIAWGLLGYEMIRDEDYEWSGVEYEDRDRVQAVMVGDDQVFTFEVSELTVLQEGDYCPECGQIGCNAVTS